MELMSIINLSLITLVLPLLVRPFQAFEIERIAYERFLIIVSGGRPLAIALDTVSDTIDYEGANAYS